MEIVRLVFIALTVFGAGVTAVDLFGVFEHSGQGHDAGHVSGHDAAQGIHDSGHDGHATGHHDHDLVKSDEQGSLLAAGNKNNKYLGRAIGALRATVYFCLGAGPMGWIALACGEGLAASVLCALISGFLIAALARALRREVRRDLDSSLKPSDFVAQSGEVIVPIEPGRIGKVRVRKYGREQDVYARMAEGGARKGELVQVVDYDQECCLAAKADFGEAKVDG